VNNAWTEFLATCHMSEEEIKKQKEQRECDIAVSKELHDQMYGKSGKRSYLP